MTLCDGHVICRNSATDLVKQELLFVGQESGKLLAVRDLMHKVQVCSLNITGNYYLTSCSNRLLEASEIRRF